MIVIVNTAIARDLGYVTDNPNLSALGVNPHASGGNSLSRELYGDFVDLFSDETSVVYAAERKTFRADPGRRRLVTITCISSVAVNIDVASRCSIVAIPHIPASKSAVPIFQFFPATADNNGVFVLSGRISGDVKKGLIVGKAVVVLDIGNYENASEIVESVDRYARQMTEHIRELRDLVSRCRSLVKGNDGGRHDC